MNGPNLRRDVPSDFDEQELGPPARWELLRESRIVLERLALVASRQRIEASAPRGDGEAVMVVPGFATDDLEVWLGDWTLDRSAGDVMIVVIVFTIIHATMVLFGVLGLAKAMSGKCWRYPVFGKALPRDCPQ